MVFATVFLILAVAFAVGLISWGLGGSFFGGFAVALGLLIVWLALDRVVERMTHDIQTTGDQDDD